MGPESKSIATINRGLQRLRGEFIDSEGPDNHKWDGKALNKAVREGQTIEIDGRILKVVPDLDDTLGLLDDARRLREERLREAFPNVADKSLGELGKVPGLDNVASLEQVRAGLKTDHERALFDAMQEHPAGGRSIDRGPEIA